MKEPSPERPSTPPKPRLPMPHPAAFRDEGMMKKPLAMTQKPRVPCTPLHSRRETPLVPRTMDRMCVTVLRTHSSRYRVNCKLGEGSYGIVYKVEDPTGAAFALKVAKEATRSEWQRQEMMILKRLTQLKDHLNIVKVFSVWEEGGIPEQTRIHILSELCEGGSLENALANTTDYLTQETILGLFAQLISGLLFLHNNDIVHMDLKPANLLLTGSLSATTTLKISDFGISFQEADRKNAVEGDSKYMAPETLESSRKWGKPSDIFSSGVILYEMATGFVIPKSGIAWDRLRSGNPEFPEDFRHTDELKRFILTLLSPDPANRPTAADILKDPVVTACLTPLRKSVTMRMMARSSGLASKQLFPESEEGVVDHNAQTGR